MPSLGFRRISRSLPGDKGGEGGFLAKEQCSQRLGGVKQHATWGRMGLRDKPREAAGTRVLRGWSSRLRIQDILRVVGRHGRALGRVKQAKGRVRRGC